jgi:hypothetical protein
MSVELQVAIEIGPKGKKTVAVAREWPGLSRGAANEELAIARLLSYVPRYAAVAKLAGLSLEASGVEVMERYQGTGSTDFWGISFGFSEFDRQPLSSEELERELALMQACWRFFDEVSGRVSAELRKGPRGGGRDRDRIVRHVVANEWDWARQVGIPTKDDEVPGHPDGLARHREAYCSAFRACHREGKSAGRSPLRFLIRHTAFHTLDHAWEMEDKDLSGSE